MGLARRRLYLAIGGGLVAVAAIGGIVAWRLTVPRKLGLDKSRVVLRAGEATVDSARAQVAQAFAPGAMLGTGHGSMCISVHASRVCLGANTQLHLTALGEASATFEISRGTLVVQSVRDDLRIVLPTGTIRVAAATAAIEDIGAAHTVLRVLEGRATLQSKDLPETDVAAPDAVDVKDASKRTPAPNLEHEERGVTQLASGWQGTAGGIIEVKEAHGRVEVDGAYLGFAPAAVLLQEGNHTLVVRDPAREITHETLTLAAGQTVVRGG